MSYPVKLQKIMGGEKNCSHHVEEKNMGGIIKIKSNIKYKRKCIPIPVYSHGMFCMVVSVR